MSRILTPLELKPRNRHAFPEFDRRAAHSRQSKRASQVLPPACQNSFREARHHENWGLSNAIFWGKLFRRRHLFNWTAPRRTFDLAARFNHGASEPGLKCLGR